MHKDSVYKLKSFHSFPSQEVLLRAELGQCLVLSCFAFLHLLLPNSEDFENRFEVKDLGSISSTSQDTWLWNMLLFQLWRCLVRPSSVLLLLCKRGFCWALGATALHPICKLCRFFLPPSDGTFKASLQTLTSEDFKMTSARLRLPTGTCRGSCEHLNGKWSLWRAASFCKGVGLSWNWTAIPPFSLV